MVEKNEEKVRILLEEKMKRTEGDMSKKRKQKQTVDVKKEAPMEGTLSPEKKKVKT